MKRRSESAAALLCSSLTGIFAAALGGCGETYPQVEPPPVPPVVSEAKITYSRDIKPLMERYCTTCHRSGDIAPFTLTDYQAVMSHATQIQSAVQAGLMPPWLPGEASMQLRYSRAMRPEDKKLLLDWLSDGAPAGDPASPPRTDLPPAESESPPRADMVLKSAQPYQPDTTSTDDYHCFVFDPKLDHDRFLLAGQVNPDNRAIAHHMALFLISPAQADQVRMMDQGGKGYTCFGGAGKNIAGGLILAWAPGGNSMRAPAGTAFKLPKGSLLVMQMHYNVVASNGQPDQTSVELELGDTPPDHELVSMYLIKSNLLIKAGEANWKESATAPVGTLAMRSGLPAGDVTVYGVFPHMHLLGKRIAVSLVGGPMGVEIPRWDFHWQNTYTFVKPLTLHPADVLQLECGYDNSFANQPVVGGVRQPPRDVKWGESTLDEMCVTVLTVAAK